MKTATNDELYVNVLLAGVLGEKHPAWRVTAERRGVLEGAAAKKPDIVVTHAGPEQTVVLETEFDPATGVEGDASARLGQVLSASGQAIDQVIAVRLPRELKRTPQHLLESQIRSASFTFCIISGETPTETVRWPEREWITCTVDQLARCIGTVALSERLVTAGVTVLERGIGYATGVMKKELKPFFFEQFGTLLHQTPGDQTTSMAAAILADALIFQERIAKHIDSIDSVRMMKGPLIGMSQLSVLECWEKILAINYWPIFDIGRQLLLVLPASTASTVLDHLSTIVYGLAKLGAIDIQDLSGRMFQALIADRKFLATFYTLPPSATLLAELAVSMLDEDWADPEAVTGLRIADFACGTGALIGAAYQAVGTRYRYTGQDDGELHAAMMGSALIATDIMPAATHLTATTLSSMHPSKTYDDTRIITMPYGKRSDSAGYSIGSLDLLDAGPSTRLIFGNARETLRGAGEAISSTDEDRTDRIDIPHGSVDLVIMNPPFTRPTNHEVQNVPVPSFAGFGTSGQEQKVMSSTLKRLTKTLPQSVGHGNAGLASNFIDVGHVKVRPGGVLALVLPAIFVSGASWAKARKVLREEYRDVIIIAIASHGSKDRAFSADTGMAEVLVLGKRLKNGQDPGESVTIVNLKRRPRSILEGFVLAASISRFKTDRGVLDADAGSFIRLDADRLLTSGGMGAVGIANYSTVDSMSALGRGLLDLPRMRKPVPLTVVPLEELGRRGVVHRDINGSGGRGPFDIVKPSTGSMTYPSLWSHDAKLERRLIVRPDGQGMPRGGCATRAKALWHRTASRLHFTLGFRLNSQPLAACLTPDLALGGAAWPNYLLDREEWEIPVALWANTTLGLMSFWRCGSRQQAGRAIMTITRLPKVLTIDPRDFNPDQIDLCTEMFDLFKERDFLPANEAWRDPVRQDLDRAMLVDVLGCAESVLRSLTVLRNQWCEEPSVHGGKPTRPHLQEQVNLGALGL